MNENKNKDKTESKTSKDYSMKGLVSFGRNLFAIFIVWCTFNYPMSDDMKTWFFIWAVITWLYC